MSKQEYIARVQVAVSQLHDCGAVWLETVPVHEVFHGQTVWKGEVEVFDLNGHAKARRAYALSHRDGQDDQGERFVTVLELPPVDSPVTAVRAPIAADSKRKKSSTPLHMVCEYLFYTTKINYFRLFRIFR
jgi:hypothetical protein